MFFKHKTVDQVVSSLISLASELQELSEDKQREAAEHRQAAEAAHNEATRAANIFTRIQGLIS